MNNIGSVISFCIKTTQIPISRDSLVSISTFQMAETDRSLPSDSSESPREDPLTENIPIDEYINEKLVDFQEVVNQRLETFEQRLLERLTSINALAGVGSGVGTSTTIPPSTSKPRYSIKDLKPPKYAGGVLVRNADAVDQWLVKWEQTFQMCEIIDDRTRIEHASFNLQDVAHRWWRKVVKDKQEPKTWNDFKVMFINNFVPPDERSRSLDDWFFVAQRNLSVHEYADKYREIIHSIPEEIPDYLQVHKFALGLKDFLRPLVRREKCTTLSQAIEVALVYEDRRKFGSQVPDISKTLVGNNRVFVRHDKAKKPKEVVWTNKQVLP